ncbi:hypothetical protein F2Q69_00005277 [Brassica cretica]|uniref:RNase H type-1 domain-containing protein n=1 Tax=Brassica cretica TaxID=69181 RepID=A0A8S9PKF8_BRACR|nr:hypothetical protein F2Q69_00005277 [Brassica cretica]
MLCCLKDMDGRCFGAHREPTFMEAAEWKAPPRDVLKCNVGVVWGKKTKIVGAVWVLRDSKGDVLLHSRRFFAQVDSKDHAQYLGLVWAVKSMVETESFAVNRGFRTIAITALKDVWFQFYVARALSDGVLNILRWCCYKFVFLLERYVCMFDPELWLFQ